MPARMWRHVIHAFLEVLRCRLPEFFIYIVYAVMALLCKTVLRLKTRGSSAWLLSLLMILIYLEASTIGNSSRYRMAINNNESKHREV